MVLLLRKTKIKDVASLHRIIVALEYYLTHLIIALHDPRLICLTRLEEMTVDNIIVDIRSVKEHPLLLCATLQFLKAKYQDDAVVLAAAATYNAVGDDKHLTMPHIYTTEYAAAKARLAAADALKSSEELAKLAPGAFHRVVISAAKASIVKEYVHKSGLTDVRDVPLHVIQRICHGLSSGPTPPKLFDASDVSDLSDAPSSPDKARRLIKDIPVPKVPSPTQSSKRKRSANGEDEDGSGTGNTKNPKKKARLTKSPHKKPTATAIKEVEVTQIEPLGERGNQNGGSIEPAEFYGERKKRVKPVATKAPSPASVKRSARLAAKTSS